MYNHYNFNIKMALLGYKKSQVDKYINELISENHNKMSELSMRLVKLEGDKKHLEMTSLNIKRKLVGYFDENLPVNLYTEMMEVMNKNKLQPSKVIIKKPEDNTAIVKTMEGMFENIRHELGYLSDKIDGLSVKLENISVVSNNNIKLTSDTVILNESKPIPGSDATEAENTSDIYEKNNVETVIFKKETANRIKSDMTQNSSDMGKLLNFSRINKAINPITVKKEITSDPRNSFWGMAVNEYLQSDSIRLEINTHELLEYTNKTIGEIPYNSFFDDISSKDKHKKSAKKEIKLHEEAAATIENKKNIISVMQQMDKDVPDSNLVIHKIDHIDEDAEYIRQKYIVGKIAGDDLYDRNGKLIIGRNGRITSQVVNYADREGKLPELIIHMILSNME